MEPFYDLPAYTSRNDYSILIFELFLRYVSLTQVRIKILGEYIPGEPFLFTMNSA